jgi:hypothetical protein
MKLREFKFNDIPVHGLSVFLDGKEQKMGFIGEVLSEIPHLADYHIVDTSYYFDVFVIRLKSDPTEEEVAQRFSVDTTSTAGLQ